VRSIGKHAQTRVVHVPLSQFDDRVELVTAYDSETWLRL
jgi:hypothetical protein